MMTKVWSFLGLQTVLLNYYLKMKTLEFLKKRQTLTFAIFKGIPCLELLDIITVIFFASAPRDSLWRPKFCSYFHTNSLTDSPKQNCEVRKIVFSCISHSITFLSLSGSFSEFSLARI